LVETTTKNYGWVKPEIQHSPATWGGFLNDGLDSIDGVVFSNQQGLVPIGSGALWFTATAPPNWLLCYGQSLDTTAYAGLFAVIGYQFGGSGANFNLPSIVDVFPVGAGDLYGLGGRGGESVHTLSAAELAPHAHGVSDPGHNHGFNDPGHAHGIPDPGHSHGASQDAHNHTVPGSFGYLTGPVGGPNPMVNVGSTTTSTAQPGVHISASGTGQNATDARGTGAWNSASGTGIGIQNAGGGAGHNNMPPFIGINFIIRFQ
jgi:microcystin-dependent protein